MRILKENYFLHLLLALVLCATLVSQTRADPTVRLFDGVTTVQLSDDLIGALGVLGLTAGAAEPGTLSEEGVASLPVVAGALDLETSIGDIFHSGGLSFFSEDGAIVVDLLSFIIDNTSGNQLVPQGPQMTGLAAFNDDLVGRLPLFNLDFTDATVDESETEISISGVVLTLTLAGASALNVAFGVDAFTGDFNIGTADVVAIFDLADVDDTADGSDTAEAIDDEIL